MTENKKTLGVLLKESCRFLLQNNVSLIKITLAAYIPLSAFYVVFILFVNPTQSVPEENPALAGRLLLLNLLAATVSIIIVFSYHITIIRTIRLAYQAQPIKLVSLYQKAFFALGSYLWVVILTGLKIFLWSLPFWIALVVAPNIYGWFLIFLIPGFVFGILYSFATMSFILEGKKGGQALSHSASIIKPAFWKFLGNVIVVVLVVIPFYLLIRSVIERIFGVAHFDAPDLIALLGVGLESCLNAVVGLFPTVFIYFLYKELDRN